MQFDFGRNWAEYSAKAVTPERILQAKTEFLKLLEPAGGISGKSFLDIGFGQGFSLLSAASAGADAYGCDINPTCGEVLERNRIHFEGGGKRRIPIVIGSILDDEVRSRLAASSPGGKGYDVVHSWGVLHHTGNMRLALANAASLVKPGGHFVVALYNRHWSSRPWLAIKYAYCKSPRIVQSMMIRALYPVIYAAKWLVTRADPRRQSRGMDFYYNVVDWVGGYPYEYASLDEAVALVEPLGFACIARTPSEVPTGCNEFVFRRVAAAGR